MRNKYRKKNFLKPFEKKIKPKKIKKPQTISEQSARFELDNIANVNDMFESCEGNGFSHRLKSISIPEASSFSLGNSSDDASRISNSVVKLPIFKNKKILNKKEKGISEKKDQKENFEKIVSDAKSLFKPVIIQNSIRKKKFEKSEKKKIVKNEKELKNDNFLKRKKAKELSNDYGEQSFKKSNSKLIKTNKMASDAQLEELCQFNSLSPNLANFEINTPIAECISSKNSSEEILKSWEEMKNEFKDFRKSLNKKYKLSSQESQKADSEKKPPNKKAKENQIENSEKKPVTLIRLKKSQKQNSQKILVKKNNKKQKKKKNGNEKNKQHLEAENLSKVEKHWPCYQLEQKELKLRPPFDQEYQMMCYLDPDSISPMKDSIKEINYNEFVTYQKWRYCFEEFLILFNIKEPDYKKLTDTIKINQRTGEVLKKVSTDDNCYFAIIELKKLFLLQNIFKELKNLKIDYLLHWEKFDLPELYYKRPGFPNNELGIVREVFKKYGGVRDVLKEEGDTSLI